MNPTTPARYIREPIWHVELAVVMVVVLQVSLSSKLTLLPPYVLGGLELLLLIGLHISHDNNRDEQSQGRRLISLMLTGFVTLANIISLWLVCSNLVSSSHHLTGQQLIVSALGIYLTNIIVFGLWYWQLDGGGPGGRGTHKPPVDFLFPQMTTNTTVTQQPGWRPAFFDYLFISITNATAFSPTDALPLTHRAKLLMAIQALVSLLTIALVAARAINILS